MKSPLALRLGSGVQKYVPVQQKVELQYKLHRYDTRYYDQCLINTRPKSVSVLELLPTRPELTSPLSVLEAPRSCSMGHSRASVCTRVASFRSKSNASRWCFSGFRWRSRHIEGRFKDRIGRYSAFCSRTETRITPKSF